MLNNFLTSLEMLEQIYEISKCISFFASTQNLRTLLNDVLANANMVEFNAKGSPQIENFEHMSLEIAQSYNYNYYEPEFELMLVLQTIKTKATTHCILEFNLF